ncbi:MAG: helix-turn-helix domain-containing protein [Hyphomicrobiaceae bacterium]|nr:helix-turn-helix domain-containing protein [Hyphomicrobiaceae bacterium]
MTNVNLRDALERLGLKQVELARLLDVSARTVSLWATGEGSLPGPVAAYLRVLGLLPADLLAAELRRVNGRSKMIDEGLYNVEYRSSFFCDESGACGSALAVLRNGKILGSDRWGGVFSGSYEFDPVKETNSVHLRLHVPPEGELVTGFAAGPKGAIIEIAGQFERAAPVSQTVADIAGEPVEVTMTFLGALPN